jgi:peroxiredoxin
MFHFLLPTAYSLVACAFLVVQPGCHADEPSRKEDPSKPAGKTPAKQKAKVSSRRVPNFVLPDSTGKQVALSDYSDAELLVLVFLGTKCPIANAYVPELLDLQKRYKDRNVQIIGINANPSDNAETIDRHMKEFKIDFPVLIDSEQLAMDLTKAQRTPETLVLDRRRIIRYRGRIDDRVGYDHKRDKARRSDLEEAIKEVLAGKNVSVAEAEVEGCLITRRVSGKDASKITYAKDVAPILQNRCVDCHHPGTAAPFSLLAYEDARDWAAMIKENIVERRMPPWIADPRHGKFSNDLRMTKEEVDTIVAWIDHGTPLGEKKDLPRPRAYTEGWLIGKPDIVFKMPNEYTVQASGTVEYQYFVTPTNFKEDTWVQAAEAHPSNRAVVHHIIAFMREKGGRDIHNLPLLGGFAPGEEPMILPKGVGFKVPAGAEIVWQIHYTPTGKEEKDRSELGLILCKESPERALKGSGAFNTKFSIPPGANNHRVVSKAVFKDDVELMTLMPHMHLRGKDFRYTALYPDGRKEILLNVPDYDFNWQHTYRFARPVPLPRGTTLECIAHFDNSAANPANPDSTKTVSWGDQTWEEMMIGWYSLVDTPKPNSDKLQEKPTK